MSLTTTAAKLIAKQGASVTLTRVTQGTYDETTATLTNTEATETISAVIEEASGRYFDKDSISKEDKQFTIAATVGALSMSDKLTFGGNDYKVANIHTIFKGNDAVIYIVHGQKA